LYALTPAGRAALRFRALAERARASTSIPRAGRVSGRRKRFATIGRAVGRLYALTPAGRAALRFRALAERALGRRHPSTVRDG